MKRIILSLVTAILAFTYSNAQSFIVYGTDGSKTEYETSKVEKIEFKEADPYNGHEYVDLGLPSSTLWATCNIGANKPEEYGDYFAWGETIGYNSGKTDFTMDTYKYYKTAKPDTIIEKDEQGFETTTIVYHEGYTKYVPSHDASVRGYDGFYDDKMVLELSDDAASVNWGGKWIMPTKDQWEELRDNCTWTWCTLNDVNGYKVTGTNGKYIFLPATGRRRYDFYKEGSYVYYWSSSLYLEFYDMTYHPYYMYQKDSYDYQGYQRYYGIPVRAVCIE